MDIDWVVLGVGYVLFLILSRGVLGGAGKALSDWGGASARARARARARRASTSTSS